MSFCTHFPPFKHLSRHMPAKRSIWSKTNTCPLVTYLLHSVYLETHQDSCKSLETCSCHHSYTEGSTEPCGNTVPCNLRGIDKFFHGCTNHCWHISYHIRDQDLKEKQFETYSNTTLLSISYFSENILFSVLISGVSHSEVCPCESQ